jgi:hypothetical protein
MGDRAFKFKIEARIDKGGLEPPMSVQLPALSMTPLCTKQALLFVYSILTDIDHRSPLQDYQ